MYKKLVFGILRPPLCWQPPSLPPSNRGRRPFIAVDLNHDGATDIVTSTDKGTFSFYNRMHGGRVNETPGQ